MNMLDRVADAIRCAFYDDKMRPWDYLTDMAKEPWRKKAKSVLLSITVAGDGIHEAGAEAYDGADPCDTPSEAMGAAWTAMINAILEGK